MSVFLGALGAALIGAVVYGYQRAQDRKFAVIEERRNLYVEFVRVVTPSLYKHVQTRSPEHHTRLESLNSIGGVIQVIAPISVCDAFREFVEYLKYQTQNADPNSGEHPAFFDETAGELYDKVLLEMRRDALPRGLDLEK